VERPLEQHLGNDELDALVSSQVIGVTSATQLSDEEMREAQRHVESCQDCERKVQMHKSVQSEILRMGVPGEVRPGSDCIGDVEWLSVAAGLLSTSRTEELMKHAAQCGHCGPLLKKAEETLSDETAPSEETLLASLSSARPAWRKNMAETLRADAGAKGSDLKHKKDERWWQALFAWPRPTFALAGIAVAVMAVWLGSRMLRPPTAEQLLAQAYTEHRTVEVRIPGAKYAPMRVERAVTGSSLDKPPSLLKAEALIGENLRKNPNDEAWLKAKARADLLDGNYESAIKSLQQALETQPDDPSLLIDLGSAYFVRAEAADRAIDYGNAIESLGKALTKSPDDPVALFNRALACERMYLYTQAVDDWEHYLRVDPQGEWSDDARKRLNNLQEKLKSHKQSQSEPLLTPSQIANARLGGNTLRVQIRGKIDDRIEDYLNLAVSDWLPEAYPATTRPNTAPSATRSALSTLAEIASEKHDDRWLADLLSGSSAPSFTAAVAQLSDAFKANDRGNNLAAQQYAFDADHLFTLGGHDAGALRARVEYVFASHDSQNGQRCLDAARGLGQRLKDRPYRWLEVQFHIEQGTCYRLKGNLGESRRLYELAAQEAQASKYRVIYLRTQDHLSGVLGATGSLSEGWARAQYALARFWSGTYPEMRGYNLYYELYEFSRQSKQSHLQMSIWRDGLSLSESFSDKVLRAMAHSFMAHAAISAEQPEVAEMEFTRASELFQEAPQIKSTDIDRMEVETRLAEIETGYGRPQQAVSRLLPLQPEVSLLSDNFLAIFFYTTLGEAESRLGDGKQAEPALRSAIALSELHLRSVRDDKSRIEWVQQTSKTYRNFVELRLHQGDVYGALEVWEWYRGAALRSGDARGSTLPSSPSHKFATGLPSADLHEVTSLLPSLTNETVLSYALLPDEVVVWVYDNRGIFAHWIEGRPRDIEAKATWFRRLCSDGNSNESETQAKRPCSLRCASCSY
jgi:tetratricopeptide (TPR) repeat protein